MGELRNPVADRWDLDRGFRVEGLGACFPRGITFADVDSETEINGHWLVVEGKRDGEQLSRGQRHTNLARVRDGRTVLVVYGDPPYTVTAIEHFTRGRVKPATLADVHRFCADWATWAEAQPSHRDAA